jgi:hypothetical protein
VRTGGGPAVTLLARKFPGWSFCLCTGWLLADREGVPALAVAASAALLEFCRRFDAGEWPDLEG